MDEIFGYFPPTANPPSKQPMLTLLKQARAFGLGCVLATQNPVDLDYKGLANCGTWFIGRLQTERDKLRVIEGLKSALAGGEDGADLEALMSQPHAARVPHAQRARRRAGAHEDALGAVLSARAADRARDRARDGAAQERERWPRRSRGRTGCRAAHRPRAPRPRGGRRHRRIFPDAHEGRGPVLYKPMVAGFAKLHFVDAKLALDEWQTAGWLAPFDDGGGNASWEDAAQRCAAEVAPGQRTRGRGAEYGELPGTALRAASYSGWAKALQSHLYETARASLFWSATRSRRRRSRASPKATSARASRWRRARSATPRWPSCARSWQAKLLQLQDQIRRAEERREREKSQLSQQKMQTAVTIGSSILGALLGRKAISATNVGRVGIARRARPRASGANRRTSTRAEESLEVLQQRLEDTQREVEAEVARLETTLDAFARIALRAVEVPARKSDIAVGEVALVWAPWRKGADGFPAPAYD